MTVFHQLGDPVAGAAECLCQHHGAAYAEWEASTHLTSPQTFHDTIAHAATIVSQAITITERCCVVVNTAIVTPHNVLQSDLHIERPAGVNKTTQSSKTTSVSVRLHHAAAWEVLDSGTYTYYLVNRAGYNINVHLAWLKIIASDCEG